MARRAKGPSVSNATHTVLRQKPTGVRLGLSVAAEESVEYQGCHDGHQHGKNDATDCTGLIAIHAVCSPATRPGQTAGAAPAAIGAARRHSL